MRSRSITVLTAALLIAIGAASGITEAQVKVIATVDGKPVTEADVRLAEREIGAADIGVDERRRLATELVIQRQVIANAAERAKLDAETDFEQRLAYARRSLLQLMMIEKQAREAASKADAKRIYDEQSAKVKPADEVHVRLIVIEDAGLAKEMREQIVNGADFATIARAISTDTASARAGGDLGWHLRSELPAALAEAAFSLKTAGEVSPLIRTAAGWQILQLDERRSRQVRSYEEMRYDITRVRVQEHLEKAANELRRNANVVYKDPALQPDAPVVLTEPMTTVAAAITPTAPQIPTFKPAIIPAQAVVSRWRHEGAPVKLYAANGQIVVLSDAGSPGNPARQLLAGTRRGVLYNGEAVASSLPCGARSYAVSGEASVDGNKFTLRGQKPILDANCTVVRTEDAVLVFEYVGLVQK